MRDTITCQWVDEGRIRYLTIYRPVAEAFRIVPFDTIPDGEVLRVIAANASYGIRLIRQMGGPDSHVN